MMEGNGLCPIHLHLVQKQIVFVPLYFSIDYYLFFVSVPLPNRPQGCESVVRLSLGSCRMRAQWLCNGRCYWEDWGLVIYPQPEIMTLKPNRGVPLTTEEDLLQL